MSRKKVAQKKDDEHPPVKFELAIPIRPDPDPKDKSHYRVLGPEEKLPPEYAEPFVKDLARVFVDSLDQFGVRVKDIPEGEFAKVYRAWWGYFWEPKKDGQPPGPKTKALLELLISILERKAAILWAGEQAGPAAPDKKPKKGGRRKGSAEG